MKFQAVQKSHLFIIAFHIAVLAQQPTTEKLLFSHARGFYTDNFDLTISTTTPGSLIKYTKDGADPTTSASAFSGISPVTIRIDPANSTDRDVAPGYCIRAVAIQHDTAVTAVKTHTYLFYKRMAELSPDGAQPGPGWPDGAINGQQINYGLDPTVTGNRLYKDKITAAFMDIPTISMVMNLEDLFDPQTGIYVHADRHGIEWERPCSIELLHPDGSDGFHINAGVRIRGGYSRMGDNPKHAFRLFFRGEYGETKLRYPLFGDEGVDEFDKVDLRTAQNYSWSFNGSDINIMNRDVFSRDCQRDMGQPYTRSRYYHLFINGTYWGLFQTQERSEASFGASYFGGLDTDYDVVKVAADAGYVIEATDGNLDAWRSLWQTARDGFTSDAAYYKIQGKNPDGSDNPALPVLLDIDNMIDYLLITYIGGNLDAPVSNFLNNTSPNNFYAIYNRNARDGFTFYQHDAEHTLLPGQENSDRTGPYPAGNTFEKSNPQWLHQQLMQHPKYRARFADRVAKHFFGDGALTPHQNIARFMARKEEIDLAIIAESARWGDSKSSQPFTRDVHWLNAINMVVDGFFPNRTASVLQQLRNKQLYPMAAPPVFNSESALVDDGFLLTMSGAGEIFYTTDGTDPFNPSIATSGSKTLVPTTAARRVLVPENDPTNLWRRRVDYNDSNWRQSTGAVGYEHDSGYENRIQTDVGAEMASGTSCYVRIPFTMNKAEIAGFNILQLKMLYDDGFVAFLNGVQIAAVNAPSPLTWNAAATVNHEADAWETFPINDAIARIVDGANLLAIHALNVNTSSSDFIVDAELIAAQVINSGEASATAQIFQAPLTIERTTTFKARTRMGQDWSACTEATLYVLQDLANLRFTEIHYHPMDEADTTSDDSQYEFIELKNIGKTSLDLAGLHFGRGVQFVFGENTALDAGEFVVLAANADKFAARYGLAPFGQYVGKLDNSGETLALVNAAGDTLAKIRYNDNYPWPNSADGRGNSLAPTNVNPFLDQNDGRNWVASSLVHGTPGRDDLVATHVEEKVTTAPENFVLYQNYPNPFNPSTTIRFELPASAQVRLDIYNILGQHVHTLAETRFDAGNHALIWNASAFGGGLYFCRMEAGEFTAIKKLVFVK